MTARFAAVFALLGSTAAFGDVIISPYATKNVNVSQAYHQKLLNEIGKVITSLDNPDCAGLKIKYYIPEAIPTDYSSQGIILTNAERRKLVDYTVNNGGNVIFVAALSACGVENEPSVAGCSSSGKAATVELSGNVKQDAMALLHEIGHSMTLAGSNPASDERRSYKLTNGTTATDNSHLKDKTRVMYYQLAGGKLLSAHECGSYLKSNDLFSQTPSGGAIVLADAELGAGSETTEVVSVSSDLVDLLGQVWLHEPPIQALKEAIEAAGGLSEIREIIAGDDSPLLWSNALVALAYFGVESDVGLVRFFLERELPIAEGQERVVTDAKTSASFALGVLIGRYASFEGAALAFEITTPQQLSDGNITEFSKINLSGLPDEERKLAETLVLQQTVIAQEIAFGVITEEGQAALAGESAAFATAFGQERSGERMAKLNTLGLDPEFLANLPDLTARIGEFQKGEVGVPYESLNLSQPK